MYENGMKKMTIFFCISDPWPAGVFAESLFLILVSYIINSKCQESAANLPTLRGYTCQQPDTPAYASGSYHTPAQPYLHIYYRERIIMYEYKTTLNDSAKRRRP